MKARIYELVALRMWLGVVIQLVRIVLGFVQKRGVDCLPVKLPPGELVRRQRGVMDREKFHCVCVWVGGWVGGWVGVWLGGWMVGWMGAL